MEVPVLICDDNQLALDNLTNMLQRSADMLEENDYMTQIFLNIVSTNSYQEASRYVKKENIKFGLYFLDIELNEGKSTNNGIDLAEKIMSLDKHAKIVFVTNYKDMAFLTYQRRIGAIDYIVKTSNLVNMQKRLNDTLENIIRNYSQEEINEVISYRLGTRVININLDNLLYIETSTMPHRLNLVKDSGISFIKGSLKEFENNSNLLRISQSCVINPKKIKQINISNNTVAFSDGNNIKYSRKMRKFMRNFYITE